MTPNFLMVKLMNSRHQFLGQIIDNTYLSISHKRLLLCRKMMVRQNRRLKMTTTPNLDYPFRCSQAFIITPLKARLCRAEIKLLVGWLFRHKIISTRGTKVFWAAIGPTWNMLIVLLHCMKIKWLIIMINLAWELI